MAAETTDSLYSLVTAAIVHAERLEEDGEISAQFAWAEVSLLEEQLAAALPASQAEGQIARRGAVLAALKAGDPVRAQTLAQHYFVSLDEDQSA